MILFYKNYCFISTSIKIGKKKKPRLKSQSPRLLIMVKLVFRIIYYTWGKICIMGSFIIWAKDGVGTP